MKVPSHKKRSARKSAAPGSRIQGSVAIPREPEHHRADHQAHGTVKGSCGAE